MGLLRASATWIQGELTGLGVPPAVAYCLGHAARTRPESLPPQVPSPHVGRDTVYAFVISGIDNMRATPLPELRMNIAEKMWWAAFSNTAGHIFSKSYAEQERRRELAPDSMSAYLQAQLAYREAARLCTRYWKTLRGADGRYVAVGSSGETDSDVAVGVYCLWHSNGHSRPVILVTDETCVGFFELADVKASDLNDGNPSYGSLDYLLEAKLYADPVIDTDCFQSLKVERTTRNTFIEFLFDDDTKWKFEITRELLYGEEGVSHRKILNDFLGTFDAAWTSILGDRFYYDDDYDEG